MDRRSEKILSAARVALNLACGALIWAALAVQARAAAELDEQIRAADLKYRQQLAELADALVTAGDAATAERVRDWARPRDPRKLYLPQFPESDLAAEDSAEPPNAEGATGPAERVPVPGEAATDSTTQVEPASDPPPFAELRRQQAEVWFELARRAIRQRRVAAAFDLVLAAARENPDHAGARQLLGYVRSRERWHTPYEVRKLRAGQVWHPRFGWLPATNVPRYEAGERQYGGRWIPAAEEARLRQDLTRGWRVETEHYLVTTNHSLEAGVALGRQLERVYRAWHQVFAGYVTTAAQLAQMLEGRPPPRSSGERFQVVLFRTREQYNAALRQTIVADIGLTTGLYLNDARRAYFFASENPDPTTVVHEATHQLFSETRSAVPIPGGQANFWIVEGVACYMESLAEERGYLVLGGSDAIRFRDARYRLLESQLYVPLEVLTAAGAGVFQRDPDLPKLYSQSAGLAHFLMHADGGRYRDALTQYLVAVYAGDDTPATLSNLTGAPYARLDEQYKSFVADAPADAAPADATPVGQGSP